MIKKILYILLFQAFILNTLEAQDYHFAQFDANPFYINPALTGERLSDYKGIQINANYRDQMAQYSKPPSSFKSVAVGIDEPINSKFSVGQSFYNNKAASGSFNTFGFMLSGAYHLIEQKADQSINQNLSVGMQLGFFNMSIHPENFTYDEQYTTYSEDGFDRSLPSGETFARQSYTKLNFNFGMYYRVSSKNKKMSGFGGFSIYNITQTNESFFDGYSPAALRFNLHAGGLFVLSDKVSFLPQVLYMNQAKANELNANLLFFSKIEGSLYEPIFGFGFRNKDAVFFQAGLRYKGITFRCSYDIITNYTKVYKNKGLEFSLVYAFTKKVKNTEAKEKGTPSAEITQP